jgi:hypothetical protein
MPRISHEQKQLYKSKIRALISRDHQFTQRELRLKFEADGLAWTVGVNFFDCLSKG